MTVAPNDFTHLHVHSEFSLLDGLGRINELVDAGEDARLRLARRSRTTARCTARSPSTRRASTAGIKPIIGVETYVARRSMTDREGKADDKPYHLILLARDWTGYQNLCRIVTDAHLDGYYYKPRIDRDFLAKHSEGLIGLSACLGGEVARALETERLGRGAARSPATYQRHPGPGQLLPRAAGPRPARAAPAQRAAAAPGAGDGHPAGRHQRPALRPARAVRGARRAAVRRHRVEPRHAGPDEVRDARLLPEVRGRDGRALPRHAGGDRQHAPDRRDDRPRAAAGQDCACPTSRCRTATRWSPGCAPSASAACASATATVTESSRSGSTTSSA